MHSYHNVFACIFQLVCSCDVCVCVCVCVCMEDIVFVSRISFVHLFICMRVIIYESLFKHTRVKQYTLHDAIRRESQIPNRSWGDSAITYTLTYKRTRCHRIIGGYRIVKKNTELARAKWMYYTRARCCPRSHGCATTRCLLAPRKFSRPRVAWQCQVCFLRH